MWIDRNKNYECIIMSIWSKQKDKKRMKLPRAEPRKSIEKSKLKKVSII